MRSDLLVGFTNLKSICMSRCQKFKYCFGFSLLTFVFIHFSYVGVNLYYQYRFVSKANISFCICTSYAKGQYESEESSQQICSPDITGIHQLQYLNLTMYGLVSPCEMFTRVPSNKIYEEKMKHRPHH